MNNKTANILYAVLIASLIIFMVWFVFWLQSESKECVANPVRYFTDKNENIYCNCYDDNGMFVEGINEEVNRIFKPNI